MNKIRESIEKLLEKHRIVVWYDAEEAFTEEFENLEFEQGQKAFAELRRVYPNLDIIEKWGVSASSFSKYTFDRWRTAKSKDGTVYLNEDAERFMSKRSNARQVLVKGNKNENIKKEEVKKEVAKNIEVRNEEMIKEGTNLVINKSTKGSDISALFERLSLFLESDCVYNVNIRITEDEEGKS